MGLCGRLRLERFEKALQGHLDRSRCKFDERCRVKDAITGTEDVIVCLLLFADDGFDGDEFEGGVVVIKKQRVPEATDAAVAIFKGMNELDFAAYHGGANQQGMAVRACEFQQFLLFYGSEATNSSGV